MNFTRDPIIETIVTPKEGYKLVIRSSKISGQEEFFVDALEIISIGHSCFYRSMEKPKNFILPVSDYEILEVRETRTVLKTTGVEKGIKIAGGRSTSMKSSASREEDGGDEAQKGRKDRKRTRRKKEKDEVETVEEGATAQDASFPEDAKSKAPKEPKARRTPTPAALSALLPPPPTLISESISKYKDTPLYAGAFYEEQQEEAAQEEEAQEVEDQPSSDDTPAQDSEKEENESTTTP